MYSSPTTSSLTQGVPYSSRAMWASWIASRAVVQPAVLGSRRALCVFIALRMMSTKPLSPAAASWRFKPTVTICVPEAAIASASTCGDG